MLSYRSFLLLLVLLSSLSACFHDGPKITDDTSGQDSSSSDQQNSNANLPTLTMTVSDDELSVDESVGSVGFTLTLSEPVNEDVAVAYQATGVRGVSNSATRQDDFLLFNQSRTASSGSVIIPANSTVAGFTVNIKDDTIDEDDEVFAVNLKADDKVNVTTTQLIVTILDNDALPILSLKNTDQIITVDENVGAIAVELQMPYTQSGEDVEIPISWSYPSTQAATPGEDFVALQSVIYPGVANVNRDLRSYTFNILIQDDAVKENTETFFFKLQNPIDGKAALDGNSTTTLTIIVNDDDALGGINDTQIVKCADQSQAAADCATIQGFPGQDGKVNTPFIDHFKRIDAQGDETTQVPNTICIKDTTTGLLWEVKRSDDSNDPRYMHNRFAWYNTFSNSNGGSSGTAGDTNSCGQTLEECSSHSYINELNSGNGLCYNKKWRLPKVHELVSIMSFKTFDIPSNPVMVDQDYFPNTRQGFYWTASPTSEFPAQAWAVYFGETPSTQPGTEFTVPYTKTEHLFIRAVANSN